MTAPEVPATNDPKPWLYSNGQRTAHRLAQTCPAWSPRPEFDAEVPADEGMPTVEHLCEVMHDAYEKAAVGAGWETNPDSRKPWSDVPEANKETMRAAVSALLPLFATELQKARAEGANAVLAEVDENRPKNPESDWTEYAHIRNDMADQIHRAVAYVRKNPDVLGERQQGHGMSLTLKLPARSIESMERGGTDD